MQLGKVSSYLDKVGIVIEMDKGVKRKDIAQMFKTSVSTLSMIPKNYQRIVENQSNFGLK